MPENPLTNLLRRNWPFRSSALREEDFEHIDRHLKKALTEYKHSGLLLAVRARWIALAIVAVLLPYINPHWDVLYYEVALIALAVIGWAQFRAGRVVQSRRELRLITLDLALLAILMVLPNPFSDDVWPTASQFHFADFSYYYMFLALGTLAYSWRTLFSFAMWTTVFWLGAVVLVMYFGHEIPALSEKSALAFAGYERLIALFDPNDLNLPARIQELTIFLIVTGILIIGGRRNNQLLFQQAAVARERANLARHFPPNIVDQLADRDQPLGAVRSQDVAVMFADIVGFTRMAERQTPVDVVDLLRQFHARLEALVFQHHGTLDKFLGDGLMATFGTPDAGPGDASNALRCAQAMLADMEDWNEVRIETGKEPIPLSIGLHYGSVIIGDIGSERRLEYAVLGDTVNVASRLEALTRELGVRMVLSDDLVEAVRDGNPKDGDTLLSDLKRSGERSLRGREMPVDSWTL